MFRRNRIRRSAIGQVHAAEVQTLEQRRVLAAAIAEPMVSIVETQPPVIPVIVPEVFVMPIAGGTVSVGVSRAGDVTISGDAADNFVVVDIGAGNLQLSAWETGTKFRTTGQLLPADFLSISLPAALRSLSVNLRGGDDTLRVRFQSDIGFSRDLQILLGDGDDFLEISAFDVDVRIGGDAAVDLGSGDDRGVCNLMSTASLIVARDINVRTGSGGDSFLFIDYHSMPADALEDPRRLREVVNNTAEAQSQRIRAGRDFNVDLGLGDDQLTLMTVEAGRDITINASRGIDAAALGNVRAGRGMFMTEIEAQALQNITVVGTCMIRTGSGPSRTVADQLQLGRLEAVLGGSNDTFALGENVAVRMSSIVNGSAGRNVFYSGKVQPRISFRNLTPGLKPEETLQILSGILSTVPRPAWSIQLV